MVAIVRELPAMQEIALHAVLPNDPDLVRRISDGDGSEERIILHGLFALVQSSITDD